MKLYATVTSERASKGQGGNEHLEIKVKDGNQEIIFEMRIIPINTGFEAVGWYQSNGERYFQHFLQGKGERQKGETLTVVNCKAHNEEHCEHCPKFPGDKVMPDKNGNCSLCGLHKA